MDVVCPDSFALFPQRKVLKVAGEHGVNTGIYGIACNIAKMFQVIEQNVSEQKTKPGIGRVYRQDKNSNPTVGVSFDIKKRRITLRNAIAYATILGSLKIL